MATISRTGIVGRDLEGYTTLLQERFRDALGQDIALEPETPQGQMIGVLALTFAEMDELLLSVANGTSVNNASGFQLDNLGSLLSIARRLGVRSQVDGTLGGQAGTLIPAGATARASTGGVLFESIADATLDASGAATATFRAIQDGVNMVAIGELTEIVSLIPGWDTITNAAAAVSGSLPETDSEYRNRLLTTTAVNSTGSVEAIRAALLNLPGIAKVRIDENETSATDNLQGISLPAHSIHAIIQLAEPPASAMDIARVIYENKPAGILTSGNQTENISAPGSLVSTPIRFRFVRLQPLRIDLAVVRNSAFIADTENLVKNRLVDYVNGNFAVNPENYFDTTGQEIGEAIDERRLQTPINSIPGFAISSLQVRQITTGGAFQNLPAITPLDVLYTLAAEDIDINGA